LGTLAAHVRKGFEIDGNFEATLDGQSKVLVTAVLERTAVYEIPYALWAGRQLARLDRLEVADPGLLKYKERSKHWVVHTKARERGRNAQPPKAKVGKPLDPRHCPGSNQAADGDARRRPGRWASVTCSVCGGPTYVYTSRKAGGLLRNAHLLPIV